MSDKPYPKPVKLLTKKKLLVSWQASKDSKGAGGAPGIDGITPETFRRSLERHLLRIADEAKSGEFKFLPLRASPIPKGDGRHRIICVPTVRDRLVQRVILHYLTDKRDLLSVKTENSFGATKGLEHGTHAAIQLAISRRQKQPFVLKTDISKFFDNVPREYLLKQIKTCLGQRSVVPLLEQVIQCEISQKSTQQGELIKQSGIVFGKGLRQGMPLSPLLSNLVLSKFDQKLAKLGKSFIRYVDDLIVFEDSEAECQETFTLVENELKKLALSIPALGEVSSKSEIKKPHEEVVFLGLSIYEQRNGQYAKRIPNTAFSDLAARMDVDVSFENFEAKGKRNSKSFSEYNNWFSSMIRGYCAAYSGATNLARFEEHAKKLAEAAKKRLLLQIFGQDTLDSLDDRKRKFLGIN